jgi:excisionase family DNA binding protein
LSPTLPVISHTLRAYTIKEVAAILRCSTRHVWRQISSGKLKRLHAGAKKTLVTETELRRFMEDGQG